MIVCSQIRHGGSLGDLIFHLFLDKNLFNPAHLSIRQPHLDAMGMAGGFGEDILDNTPGQFSTALVFFQYDVHFDSGFYICSVFAIHQVLSFVAAVFQATCLAGGR